MKQNNDGWREILLKLEIRSYNEGGGFTCHIGSLDNKEEVLDLVSQILKQAQQEVLEKVKKARKSISFVLNENNRKDGVDVFSQACKAMYKFDDELKAIEESLQPSTGRGGRNE